MDAWKYEIYFSCTLNWMSYSFALLTREISWSTLEINFIFPHIHVLFSTFIVDYASSVCTLKQEYADFILISL